MELHIPEQIVVQFLFAQIIGGNFIPINIGCNLIQIDTVAIKKPYQYLFGRSILVSPVVAAGVKKWDVYLPKGPLWYNFWTGKKFTGGKTVSTDAPTNEIPLYIKAGSIIPLGKIMQYTGEKKSDTLELRLYKGANGSFTLYEDEGDNYTYEKGNYTTIQFNWNEKTHQFKISALNGNYLGYLKNRVFNLILVGEGKTKRINYDGKSIAVTLN